jgi:hypothetical protein
MQLSGILKVKKDEQSVNERFRKREFILTDNSSQYPQFISFQLTQDRCSQLDSVNVGESITVHFNIRGREWTSPQGEIKYFNSLEAWKIDRMQSRGSGEMNQSVPDYSSVQQAPPSDDLPF